MSKAVLFLLLAGLSFALEVVYSGKPVTVEVSDKGFTVFVFPDEVKKALTSSEELAVRIKGREVLVRLKPAREADLYVETARNTYLFYLKAKPVPPDRVVVIDVRKKREVPKVEKESPHEELMALLIKGAVNGSMPAGYYFTAKKYVIDTPLLLIEVIGHWDGWFYRVIKARLVAKERVRVREDMEFFEELIRAEWGRPYALAIGDEFLEDGEGTYLVAVVKKEEDGQVPVAPDYDEVIKEYLRRAR